MKPHRFVRKLDAQEEQDVEQLFRHGPNGRTRRRANAVRLSARHYTVPQIAEVLAANAQSVHNWLDAFEAGGVGALEDKPRPGAPPKATADFRRLLGEAAAANPRDLGYPFTVWTVARLRAHLAKLTGKLLSDSRLRQIMGEQDLAYKRPKHALDGKRRSQGHADAFASVRHLLDELKKSPWNPVPI